MLSRHFPTVGYTLSRSRCDPRLAVHYCKRAQSPMLVTRGNMMQEYQTRAHNTSPDVNSRLRKVCAAQPVYGHFR
eukprot:1419573-Pyramimonas_sp.AAC.2